MAVNGALILAAIKSTRLFANANRHLYLPSPSVTISHNQKPSTSSDTKPATVYFTPWPFSRLAGYIPPVRVLLVVVGLLVACCNPGIQKKSEIKITSDLRRISIGTLMSIRWGALSTFRCRCWSEIVYCLCTHRNTRLTFLYTTKNSCWHLVKINCISLRKWQMIDLELLSR